MTGFRIVFMGTPAFAVASLDALVRSGAHIAGVVTAPDRPAGRGLRAHESEVKRYAAAHGLALLQPEKLRDPDFQDALRAWRADIQVVVAFRMLPESVWNMPPQGTINVHASLLPQYRGAAPINWALINGEKETGITTFRLEHQIDTGQVLLQRSCPITPEMTAGQLHDVLKELGAAVLLDTLRGLSDGTLHAVPQPFAQELRHAPKITTETCRIDWTKSTESIHNLVRGLSPYPGAFTTLEGKTMKIFAVEAHEEPVMEKILPPGTLSTDGKAFLAFTCPDGWLRVTDLQLEGKKRMRTEDFLRGWRGPSGSPTDGSTSKS